MTVEGGAAPPVAIFTVCGKSRFAAATLAKTFGSAGGAGFSYLTSHGSLDQAHVAFFRALVNGIEDTAVQDIIIDHSRMFHRLYGDIFRELGARAELSRAA